VAAAKKARVRRRNPRHMFSTESRAWHIWQHDLDAIFHSMLRNSAYVNAKPRDVLAAAVEFADLYGQTIAARRPEGVIE
jgi:hypothetical protein